MSLTGIVGRLAPSPTGYLHVGHARSFLLAWWHARSRGGRIVLRIEDLDRARAKPELVDTCLRDLEWLGIDWDGQPTYQSADLGPYEEALASLIASGAAYACTCSRKEIEAAQSAPHTADQLHYPGTCRGRYASVKAAERFADREVGLRLRVGSAPLDLEDAVRGRHSTDVQRDVGDFLLARRDRTFAYQLAVVVDDARSGITEVLRGDDLLPSTARQWHLQHALSLPHPGWIHVPMVVDPAGRRLAKRDRDLALASLRAAGVDARRLVFWAARTAGQPVSEELSASDLLQTFDLKNLPEGPAIFGPDQQSYFRAGVPLTDPAHLPQTPPSWSP